MAHKPGRQCDKRKGLPTGESEQKVKLPKHVGQQLLMKETATKSTLAHALSVLHDNGLLNLPGSHTEREFNAALIDAGSELAMSSNTPYGKVMKTTKFNLTDGSTFMWEYIDPIPYLHMLTCMYRHILTC